MGGVLYDSDILCTTAVVEDDSMIIYAHFMFNLINTSKFESG